MPLYSQLQPVVNTDFNNSGTIAALNDAVTVTVNGCSTIDFKVSGTWSASLITEGTVDGITWDAVSAFNLSVGVMTATIASNYLLQVPSGGFQQVRIRSYAYTSGTATVTWNSGIGIQLVQVFNNTPSNLNATVVGTVTTTPPSANLAITATAATGVAVTATLPAVAAEFHYITMIEIIKYATAAITGSATPVLVTTTNFPAANVFTFGTAQAVGTTLNYVYVPSLTIHSSVVNTATTIVCPATTSVIWRINVYYYAAA